MNNFNLCAAFALCGLFTLSNPVQSFSQTDDDFLSESRPRNCRMDVSIGFGQKCNLNTFQWAKFHAVDRKKTIHIGGGLRLNNLNYKGMLLTAEGSNKSGFTQFTSAGHVFGVNLMFASEYLWKGQFGVGGNIDLFGIAIGSSSPSDGESDFGYRKEGSPGITPGELGGQISSLSVRKSHGKSTGTLNSEVYGLYKLGKRTWVKAGYSRSYTDLTLNQTEDRFGANQNVLFVGLRLSY